MDSPDPSRRVESEGLYHISVRSGRVSEEKRNVAVRTFLLETFPVGSPYHAERSTFKRTIALEATTIMPVMCVDCGKKGATFGKKGTKKKLWCGDCKEPGAERKVGMCVECGKKVASFGKKGAKKVLWCVRDWAREIEIGLGLRALLRAT